MLFETLNLLLLQIDRFEILLVAVLFNQTNPNVQECTQPENKNKKPPARIYLFKKVSENLITFSFMA